jgi:hypothetical protein
MLDLRHTAAIGIARATAVRGRAARRLARLLRIRAARQTERERCAYRGGYDLSLIALGFHRFAPS